MYHTMISIHMLTRREGGTDRQDGAGRGKRERGEEEEVKKCQFRDAHITSYVHAVM